MNVKNVTNEACPTSSHKQQLKTDKLEQIPLENKLKTLESSLTRSFKPELINSVIYFIRIEYQEQGSFDSNLDKINWSKLEYFTQQLKKIVKNKTHLFLLNSQMNVSSGHHRKQKHEDESVTDLNRDYSVLINDFSSPHHMSEYFYLNQILVRLIFKLFKSKLNSNEIFKYDYDVNHSQKFYNLSMILLSSLADLCFYEEIRIQVIHDANLRCLLEIFSSLTLLELEMNFKRAKKSNCVQLMEKFWSKMCRLCANICQEKANQRVKHLFSKDFMASLAKCLDQQQVVLVTNANDATTESDLDLYHSLIRFIKYASEIENCSKLVIQNRILVFLCVYMYKLNKNLKLSNADKSTKTKENQQSDATTATDNLSTPIPMNSKHYFLFKDLVKQFLIALDSWPSSSEFYNQIIEGLFIEHLLWIQNKSTNNLNILSKESKPEQKFDYCEFSFNLLYKLCRDYHACRAEFGRIGGISKYVQKIETMTPNLSPSLNKKVVNYSYLKEYTILIDIICLTCKESVNRLRYKDQGLLVNLIKLQHILKQNKDEINRLYKNDQQTEDISFIDSTLYNKILVALCCFAHDQDSMNILLNNSLVDCLLGYLKEGLELKKRSEEEKMELVESDLDENKIFSLKKLLNLSDETRANSKKRKTLDSAETGQKAKRVNSELSAILSSSPPFLPTFQPSDVPNFENHATSPTESCLSLSPNIYISSSPPYIQSRCSSAQIFQGLSPSFYSSLSPTTSSDLPSSPSYFNLNGDQEIDNERQIKFSPSINDEASCSSACTSENEEIMEEEIDLKKEETGEDANENISQNIESINHTEACVFYVLSQLSHGDKPSVHLFQNFDSIVTALLKYLKKATVRNPRALRILNRLTKNQYCFPHFVLNHFPLKIKEVFYEAFSKREISLKAKKNLRRSKSLSGNLDTQKTQTIEKEMNVYLNSNKAFFDATSFFPSFQSIEFILINNLKSQCISSSDSGYLSLISLAKQKKPEKLASTLVAPFILRNSKALSYIMIQLNNLDLVFESIFEQKCDQKSKFTSILCIHRILSFINYKRDVKQVKDLYDQARSKINEMLRRSDNSEQSLVTFKFEGNKNIKASRTILLNKSEYFNLLLNGPFLNSDCIELKDVSEESFGILVEILNSRSLNDLDSFEERKINFEQCLDMVMTCDRFMLGDLKDLFMTGMVMKFISHGTASNCFKLAWYVNSDFLANATMDFVLSEYCSDSINDEENMGFKKFLEFLDSILASVKEAVDEKNHSDENGSQTLSDYFKKTLKYALSEIIKNNSWKF